MRGRSSDVVMEDVRPIDCERTRQWVSVALDSELSPFERALVNAHQATCPACKAFEDGVVAVTAALRDAPVARLYTSVQLPNRRTATRAAGRIARVGSAAAAAAAVAVAGAVAVAFLGPSTPHGQERESGHVLVASPLGRINDLVVVMRRPAVGSREQPWLAYGTGGIGAYKPALSPTL